ncbi:hypothetical protein [Blastococcus sp. PRF04-17]|uniref:hypothetical protein n=1 Tax=Blastococcus sp. PRF04-17 TaxID=2933797 RepID=UPI001FF1E0A1|nr:hypothetical protein [Blastococcus sp. PRF04-17]UOY00846.1 hypothetical protein MVA48_17955 [Blastococcus sp. PRF04-17]
MFQRRPSGPATRRLRVALIGVVAGAVVLASAVPASAVPAPPPNPTDGQLGAARSAQDAAAAEVGRIAALVAASEAELERVGIQAEAAGTAYLIAEEALLNAQAVAEQTAAELAEAGAAVEAAQARIATFSRDSYINNGSLAARRRSSTPTARGS